MVSSTKKKAPKPEPPTDPKVKPKHAGGRPRVAIDWGEFEKLCLIQATKEEIASWFKIGGATLSRAVKRQYHTSFEEIYKKHSVGGRLSLRRAQFQSATGGNVTMQIWLGKQMLNQRDIAYADTANKGKILDAIEKMAAA